MNSGRHTAGASRLDTIDRAIADIAAGRPVIVVDDEDRENEGDLIMAAELMTPEWMGFLIRHTSGVICTPLTATRAAEMKLPPMVSQNEDPKGTAYTVSCDAIAGTTTGISASDRAQTALVLANPALGPEAISRPGHIFPLIAKEGGVRERAGHTEAGVEFSQLAGLQPVSVIAELVHDDGSMMRLDALLDFGAEHELAVVSIEDLIVWLDARDARELPRAVTGEPVTLPSTFGTFTARAWVVDGIEHFTLESGQPASTPAPLVRVHSECLTGDIFGSHRCDCGEQLEQSLRRIADEGGLFIYMRDHEGRGIGLANKLAAYALQERGVDTVDANRALGFADDARSYGAAAAILEELGIERVRLITNNPAKVTALQELGVEVEERLPVEVPVRPENARYMETKRVRMNHLLSTAGDAESLPDAGPLSQAQDLLQTGDLTQAESLPQAEQLPQSKSERKAG
ncbi:bifunctional 3,4-dihydroxy-2-butanone-4-phosphate synthase/GTP cyclohydrolase II [Brevibacterium daeguense]|uniref:GTP cyclohydrolase-2 n=1 Tax=Brevibacterium daeguense TaxID=909936 RepID=A0ABP8EKD7_9MICO|nr:3,4-dihydroxy-2-butanone-4-phosphate synthase [Brevibacterium daeguense]